MSAICRVFRLCAEVERCYFGMPGSHRGRTPLHGARRGSALNAANRSLRTGLDESGLVGDDDRLCAVAQVELREHARDVCLHGRLCDDEGLCDLAVREATPHERDDLQLARGQVDELFATSVGGRRAAAELLDQSACDRRSDDLSALARSDYDLSISGYQRRQPRLVGARNAAPVLYLTVCAAGTAKSTTHEALATGRPHLRRARPWKRGRP